MSCDSSSMNFSQLKLDSKLRLDMGAAHATRLTFTVRG
ncbi:MAG: hypothetical protein JWQ72_215 [Polaromonas sp.]|nr:hypothetical protein [Polaromonas sp.]